MSETNTQSNFPCPRCLSLSLFLFLSFLPSFLPSFPSFLSFLSFLPSFPSFLPSFLPSFPSSCLSSLLSFPLPLQSQGSASAFARLLLIRGAVAPAGLAAQVQLRQQPPAVVRVEPNLQVGLFCFCVDRLFGLFLICVSSTFWTLFGSSDVPVVSFTSIVSQEPSR